MIALYRSVEARARGDATRELRDLATLLNLTAQRVEQGERMQSDQLRQATSFALHVVYGWESALAVLTAVRRIRFAPDEDLDARMGTFPDWLDREWILGKYGVSCSWWRGRRDHVECTTRLARWLDHFARENTDHHVDRLDAARWAPVNTWRRVCGTAADDGDLTMSRITRAPNFGRKSIGELLALLVAEGMEPVWATDARGYYRLDQR